MFVKCAALCYISYAIVEAKDVNEQAQFDVTEIEIEHQVKKSNVEDPEMNNYFKETVSPVQDGLISPVRRFPADNLRYKSRISP
jgi:hypothetical protein